MMGARSVGVTVLVLLLPWAIASGATSGPGWPQWGGGPDHSGEAAAAGQPLAVLLADVVYDPFVGLETAEAAGELLALTRPRAPLSPRSSPARRRPPRHAR